MSKQITLANAEKWTIEWRKIHPKMSKAFLIPVEDLTEILKEMGVLKLDNGNYVLQESTVVNAGIRGYMAIDCNEPAGNGEKQVFVGTTIDKNGNHNDIINNLSNNKSLDSGIYDFTTPCPSFCDKKSSPLNK